MILSVKRHYNELHECSKARAYKERSLQTLPSEISGNEEGGYSEYQRERIAEEDDRKSTKPAHENDL